MGRASRRDAELHRQQVVEGAARLFRERGVAGVSVPEAMGSAGLTHGGFYRHFGSKDELAGLAATAAFEQLRTSIANAAGDDPFDALLDFYLSCSHRDHPADGCPMAALAVEVGRTAPDSPLRAAFVEGVRTFADDVAEREPGPDDDEEARRAAALATLSTMVGAMILARATSGDPISEELLDAARGALARSGR